MPNRIFAALSGVAVLLPCIASAQILETESARLLRKGALEVGTNFEYQISPDGHEAALPFAVEYGLTDRLEFLIEPVAYTGIRSNAGTRVSGVGDIEATLTYLGRAETKHMPALAIAAEVKIPTARNTLIGTGRTDYAAYLMASRRFAGGRLDTHADIGYTFVGSPPGTQLNNILNLAFAMEWRATPATELYGEILANTAASSAADPTGPVVPGTVIPEAPSGEVVGSLGAARYVTPFLRLSLGVSLDNNGAVLFRPGFTMRVR